KASCRAFPRSSGRPWSSATNRGPPRRSPSSWRSIRWRWSRRTPRRSPWRRSRSQLRTSTFAFARRTMRRTRSPRGVPASVPCSTRAGTCTATSSTRAAASAPPTRRRCWRGFGGATPPGKKVRLRWGRWSAGGARLHVRELEAVADAAHEILAAVDEGLHFLVLQAEVALVVVGGVLGDPDGDPVGIVGDVVARRQVAGPWGEQDAGREDVSDAHVRP